jgi:ribulose-5-phosphate 4-epimerase/fuculose-1-phosphate aldolase
MNIETAREQVVHLSQELLRLGYLSGTGGNVSVRAGVSASAGSSPAPCFAITPSNFDYTQMTPTDVCVMDASQVSAAGAGPPSIEHSLHAAVYAARPDVHVVLHTHQAAASAAGLLDKDIPALFDEQVRFLGRSIEIVPYAPSGTGWLKNNIANRLKSGANAYLMQNHGALILGPDPQRALFNAELLEKCTLAYLLAYYTGEHVTRIPRIIREIIFAKLKKDQARAARPVPDEHKEPTV